MKKSANKLYDLDAIQKSFAKAAAASVPVENVSYPKPKIGSRLVDLGEEMARANGGIFLSPEAEGMHFGSPFGTINDKNATVVLPTVRDCVDAYGSWLEGSDYVDVEPERRAWILDKIFSMELVGKPVIGYMREIPSPSGYGGEKYYSDACPGIADTLLYIINHPDELAENMNEFVSLQESFENGVKPQEKPVVDAWFQDLKCLRYSLLSGCPVCSN